MTEMVREFGVVGVFGLMVPESAGIPVPSELTLLFSGFAVSQHLMSFWGAVLAATAGNVVGSLIAYGIGASGIVARLPRAGAILERYASTLGSHPLRAVFVARLLPLARTFVSLPAGARHVPLGPFTLLTTIGCGLWAAGFVLGGALSGDAWSAVGSVVGRVGMGAALGLLALWLLRRLRAAAGNRRPPSTRRRR